MIAEILVIGISLFDGLPAALIGLFILFVFGILLIFFTIEYLDSQDSKKVVRNHDYYEPLCYLPVLQEQHPTVVTSVFDNELAFHQIEESFVVNELSPAE